MSAGWALATAAPRLRPNERRHEGVPQKASYRNGVMRKNAAWFNGKYGGGSRMVSVT